MMDTELFRHLSSALTSRRNPKVAREGNAVTNSFISALDSTLTRLLERLSLDRISVYCTGFNPGHFHLVSTVSRVESKDKTAVDIPTASEKSSISRSVQGKDPFLNIYESPESLFDLSFDGRSLVFWLFSRGEYYGFVEFCRDDRISDQDVSYIKENLPLVGTFIADENFSHRLNFLIEAIPSSGEIEASSDAFISGLARQTARGFGADGATLRIHEDDFLMVKSHFGSVDPEVLEPRVVGTLISGRVFEAEGASWAAAHMHSEDLDLGPIRISESDKAYFRDRGIHTIVCCKLYYNNGSISYNYGTISYLFNRPHIFSDRDINLFRSYCSRISDSIHLINALSEIAERAAIFEIQSRRMTYVEIAHLLAHDLWHKAFATRHDAQEHLGTLQTGLRGEKIRGHDHTLKSLQSSAESVLASAETMYATSNNLRALATTGRDELYKVDRFLLGDAIDTVEQTLKPAFGRNKIKIERQGPPGIHITGPRLLFEQVIFNLAINSIDAARARSRVRPMTINLNWHVSGGRLVLRYSDDGPGIDPMVFPDIQDVFGVGRTSRSEGTGTGLPIARQFLGSHFGGNLTLTGRQPALFTIDLPLS